MQALIVSGLLTLALQKADPAIEAAAAERIPELQTWAADPALVAAVVEANGAGRTLAEVVETDREWQASSGVTEFMRGIIDHPASERLRELRATDPTLQELFITDGLGAIVAATNKTSDYYQGDEDKFVEAFAEGRGGTHVGKLARDESIQSYSIPISVPILDKGKAVGVLVAALNVEKLKR